MTKEIRSFLFHSRVQLNFEKLILLSFIRIVLGIIAASFVLGIIAVSYFYKFVGFQMRSYNIRKIYFPNVVILQKTNSDRPHELTRLLERRQEYSRNAENG